MFRQTLSRYRWVILGIALLAQVSSSLVGQALAPLAPLFQPELGLTKAEVGLFNSANFIGSWSMSLIAGSLIDRFGVRRMISISQAGAGMVMLSMALVGSAVQAAGVMLLSGMVRSSLFPGSTKAILDWFPPAARGTIIGLKQAGMPAAGVLAASTLPALGLALGWRNALAAVGLFIIAAAGVSAILYRDPGRPGLVRTRGASVRASLREVTRNRRLWVASSAALFLLVVQMSLIAYLALYFAEVVLVELVPDDRARIVAAGGYLALCQAGGAFGRVFWGVASDRAFGGRRAVVLAAIGMLSALMSLAMAQVRPDYPAWMLGAIVFVYGAGAIGWNGIFTTLVAEAADSKHAATAVGLGLTLSDAGTVGGPPLFGFVVDVTGSYRAGWLLLGFAGAAATLVALLVARGEKRVV